MSSIKTGWQFLLLVFAAGIIVSGCGSKKAAELSENDRQAFAKANDEVKQAWEKGVAAGLTTAYVTSLSIFRGMLAINLTPEQREAVTKEMTAVNQRLFDAATKGDAPAQKAVAELREN